MALFEEEDWGASSETQQLEKGLFGSNNKITKSKRKYDGPPGPRRVRGPRKRFKAGDKSDVSSEKKVKKIRRGKRKRLSEKVLDEDQENQEMKTKKRRRTVEDDTPVLKKLRLKLKTRKNKELKEKKGKSPRNKYKHLAVKRHQLMREGQEEKKTSDPREEVTKQETETDVKPARRTKHKTETGGQKRSKSLHEDEVSEPNDKKEPQTTDRKTTKTKQLKKTKKEIEASQMDSDQEESSSNLKKKLKKIKQEKIVRKNSKDEEEDMTSETVFLDSPKYEEKKKTKRKQRESNPEPHRHTQSPFNIHHLKNVLGQEKDKVKKKIKDGRSEEESEEEESERKEESLRERKEESLRERKEESLRGRKEESLRGRMEQQLTSARFRFINEQLYTCSGDEALSMMESDQHAFTIYHQGYQAQVSKWPQNPVNKMIQYIKSRPGVVVADFGCGDAMLAQSVENRVHSFDLVAVNESVTACNMAHVPLSAASIDVAVFCLSLMGTDLGDFICEASRVLKPGGKLLVAEVVSRFEKVGAFVRKLAKLGFNLLQKDASNKMFIWFEFEKVASPPPAESRPKLELAPCLYKKR